MYLAKIEAAELFQALSDRTRLRIMRIMISMPNEEICLCDMTDTLMEPEPNISRHLKVLRQSGLIQAEKQGRWVYHSLVPSDTLELFYNVVKGLPDSEGIFKRDLMNFKMVLKQRATLRCDRTSSMAVIESGKVNKI